VTTDESGFRIERDTMGEVRVPAAALWRAQTQRAVENFPISGRGLEPSHIRALARIKGAAARVNANLGVLEKDLAESIATAAAHVADGGYDDQFPVDVFQTGSGTSSNMNANEVIATLASRDLGRPVHPNDHVNASQSSNDVFPSSIHLAAAETVTTDLIPALAHLATVLSAKSADFATIVKSGRTHLMDATPVTLGQEFSGYARQVTNGVERLQATLPRLGELPLGGTAVGTGVNTPPGFAPAVIRLRELRLPDLQPGSSIMPGKVNPVVPEAVRQVAAQVIGNDATVAFAGTQGDFELNVMLPVMARNVLESIRLLAAVSRLFADRCVAGLEADEEITRGYAEGSPSIVTPLNRYLGYDEAAIAKQALASGRTIREVVIERGHVANGTVTEAQLDEALDVLRMTRP
jgi:fumarate hydratase class II